MEKSLFQYDNYRTYLKEYYSSQKEKNSFFSYQYLADKAGFKSKSFLYRIIMNGRCMSAASAIKLSRALKHTRDEAEYFENLVGYNQAKTEEEQEHYFGRLVRVTKRQKSLPENAIITPDKYELYSTWYHQVVRSLIDLYSFTGDYKWLAKKILPHITESQAKRSVELLERLELIEQDDSGVYHTVQKTITTGAQVQKRALRSYYQSCLQIAQRSINGVASDQRNISGLTLGVSEKTYHRMVERLAEVRKEFMEMADSDSEADRVYNIQFQAYPVSDSKGEK